MSKVSVSKHGGCGGGFVPEKIWEGTFTLNTYSPVADITNGGLTAEIMNEYDFLILAVDGTISNAKNSLWNMLLTFGNAGATDVALNIRETKEASVRKFFRKLRAGIWVTDAKQTGTPLKLSIGGQKSVSSEQGDVNAITGTLSIAVYGIKL